MVKSKEDTIAEFNEHVNMTAEELEAWLEDPMSKKAGTGVGLESAAKIIQILKKNPTKDPSRYDNEDLDHMRKVVGYNKRHLAQEGHLKDTKTTEELEKAKSTISLKNWGHDPLKADTEDRQTSVEDFVDSGTEQEGAKGGDAKDGEPCVDKDMGTKRKHDQSTTAEVTGEEVLQDAPKDRDTEDIKGEGDEGEGRARKKSKTTTDSEETTKATDEAVHDLLQ